MHDTNGTKIRRNKSQQDYARCGPAPLFSQAFIDNQAPVRVSPLAAAAEVACADPPDEEVEEAVAPACDVPEELPVAGVVEAVVAAVEDVVELAGPVAPVAVVAVPAELALA